MPLPTTGPISLSDIQNEFGGSNPISITEYYGIVSGIPTSGRISFSDFRGKSKPNDDVTPLPLNWSRLYLGPSYSTAQAMFTGINTDISVKILLNIETSIETSINGTVKYQVNNGSQIAMLYSVNVNISNGDTLKLHYTPNSYYGTLTFGGDILITNNSDNNAFLGNISLSVYGNNNVFLR